jgi:hypothetical protein
MGCRAVNGMILVIPNERHVQEKILKNLESRLFFEGRKIAYKDVHDRELVVQVESDGTARVERLPRCNGDPIRCRASGPSACNYGGSQGFANPP